MNPTVIPIFLSMEQSQCVEMPITPTTTAFDVIESCKEAGENSNDVKLLERWRGNDRLIDKSEKPFTLLQQWGGRASEISFMLYRGNTLQKINSDTDDQINDFTGVQGLNLDGLNSLKALQEFAKKQQKEIEQQELTMAQKERKLKNVKDQLQQHQIQLNEGEKLRRLKEKACAQEAKLAKIRMMCGQVETNRQTKHGANAELEAVRDLFYRKQKECQLSIQHVDHLTRQLDDLRKLNMTNNQSNLNNKNNIYDFNMNGITDVELEGQQREMENLKRINEAQLKILQDNKTVLKQKNEAAVELDRKIEVLTMKLRQKRQNNQSTNFKEKSRDNNSLMNKNKDISNIAAVEPQLQKPLDDHMTTAKVHPIVKHQTSLFQYNQPVQTRQLENGNIQYQPPPYTASSFNDLRRKFQNAPRALKKRTSYTEPESNTGPVIPYDRLFKKLDTRFHKPNDKVPPPSYRPPQQQIQTEAAPQNAEKVVSPNASAAPSHRDEDAIVSKLRDVKLSDGEKAQKSFVKIAEEVQIKEDASTDSSGGDGKAEEKPLKQVKGILREPKSRGSGRSIRFDPLALLLDASLEGDYEMVQDVITKVTNVSGANDEGITALHNAVCAGHYDLVRLLVHMGADVNAMDTDAWTPLHCAASCNNFQMVKFLVENGACVFATTLSDDETAPMKCEKCDDGYQQCYDYLMDIQEKLGYIRQAEVFALFKYEAQNDDELSFEEGESLTVIRKGDDSEQQWWWAESQLSKQQGYIPQNLLGLWPRVKISNQQK